MFIYGYHHWINGYFQKENVSPNGKFILHFFLLVQFTSPHQIDILAKLESFPQLFKAGLQVNSANSTFSPCNIDYLG